MTDLFEFCFVCQCIVPVKIVQTSTCTVWKCIHCQNVVDVDYDVE